jgi:hypothetical protein
LPKPGLRACTGQVDAPAGPERIVPRLLEDFRHVRQEPLHRDSFAAWQRKGGLTRLDQLGDPHYEKVGLRREGRLRQDTYRDGRYWDMFVMAMLRDEWEAPDSGGKG